MSKYTFTRTTNRSQDHVTSRPSLLPVAAIAFVAAITGTAVGFVAALSVAMPMVHQALSTEVSGINARLASSVTPDETACFEAAPSGEVLGAEASPAATTSSESTPSAPNVNEINKVTNNKFIKNLVGGQFVNNAAVIKNTGPESSNEIITKDTSITKVTNTNDVHVSTANDQNAVSGSANVSGNTNGGSASSGSADNTNATSLALTINN